MRENTRVCKYGACDFLLRKNGCGIPFGSAAAFCCAAGHVTILILG